MALRFIDDPIFAGRNTGYSQGYPWGTFQDKSSSTSNDGTPVSLAYWLSDWHGFLQALLSNGKISPSAVPDQAHISDYFDGLYKTHATHGFESYKTSATLLTRDDNARSFIHYDEIVNHKGEGASYDLSASLTSGAVEFGGTSPGSNIVTRKEEFAVDIGDISLVTQDIPAGGNYYLVRYNPVNLVLTGVPKTAKIHSVCLEARVTGTQTICAPLTCEFDLTNTWAEINQSLGLWTDSSVAGDLRVVVEYDPSSVD